MKKNLLLLMLFVGIQVLNAQSLSPANVEAYVKYQYGKSWKDIALYFVEKDVLDKDNALNFEKTFSVPGKSKNELFVDLNYWFWSAMLGAALDADYDKRPPYKVDETWTLNNCFPFAKKDATKKISSKAYVMAHGYGDMLLSNIEAQFAVTQKENPQNGTAIEMVVHLGANALAPENTLAAADSALAHGAKWIEVDVRRSKDGVLFNLHDETLDRTTNGTGKLIDMKSEDVRKLDAGSWFSPKYAGTSVPTIAEMLDHLDGKANVFFDVKQGVPLETLLKLVREKGYSAKSFFWFANEQKLRQMVEYAPDLKIKVNASTIERLKYWQKICYPSYVEIAPQNITPQFLEYCRHYNIKVMAACQEDDTSQFQQVLDSGADMVNLDRPEVFEKLMKNK